MRSICFFMLGKGVFASYNRITYLGEIMLSHRTMKPVHSLRLSVESRRQLRDLSHKMERSEALVVEIALDRMYREEIRFTHLSIHETEHQYSVEVHEEQK